MINSNIADDVQDKECYTKMESFTTADAEKQSNKSLPSVSQILKSGHYRNAAYMSLCFFMIFFEFLTIQNFQTTLPDPELALIGANTLIILYVTFTIVCLFCGEIVDRIGLKRSMIVAALTYVLYCTHNLAPSAEFAYFAALINGIGTAMLWTCNGAWLSLLIEEFEGLGKFVGGSSAGFFNGTFFALWQLSQVAGNLLAALKFSSNASVYTVLSTMTTMCAIGAGMMFFLKEPKAASQKEFLPILQHQLKQRLLFYSD
jgi:MFS family permease